MGTFTFLFLVLKEIVTGLLIPAFDMISDFVTAITHFLFSVRKIQVTQGLNQTLSRHCSRILAGVL